MKNLERWLRKVIYRSGRRLASRSMFWMTSKGYLPVWEETGIQQTGTPKGFHWSLETGPVWTHAYSSVGLHLENSPSMENFDFPGWKAKKIFWHLSAISQIGWQPDSHRGSHKAKKFFCDTPKLANSICHFGKLNLPNSIWQNPERDHSPKWSQKRSKISIFFKDRQYFYLRIFYKWILIINFLFIL